MLIKQITFIHLYRIVSASVSLSFRFAFIQDLAMYQLKITIRDSKPPIWRRVLVPEQIPFSELLRGDPVGFWLEMTNICICSRKAVKVIQVASIAYG